jgi:hypothetical protein
MQRRSDKVSPRVDEQLEQETDSLQRGAPVSSRAEEFREQEGAGEDQRDADARPTVEPAEARAELARHLQPSIFPADRTRLLESAGEMNAPDDIVSLLDELPDDLTFNDVQAVWQALGLPEPRG